MHPSREGAGFCLGLSGHLVCEISIGETDLEIRNKKLTDWRLEAGRFDAVVAFLDRNLSSGTP